MFLWSTSGVVEEPLLGVVVPEEWYHACHLLSSHGYTIYWQGKVSARHAPSWYCNATPTLRTISFTTLFILSGSSQYCGMEQSPPASSTTTFFISIFFPSESKYCLCKRCCWTLRLVVKLFRPF